MSEDAPIYCCPLCGDDAAIDFIDATTDHAEWICIACDEQIEVYVTTSEEDLAEAEEEEEFPRVFPFIIIIFILIGYIYLTS